MIFGQSANASLELIDYLDQVRKKHEGIIGAEEVGAGAKLRAIESGLLFSPSFFAEANYSDDRKQQTSPSFMGVKTIYKNYSVGFRESTPFGLTSKLYYSLAETEILGASSLFLPVNHFFDAKPVLELNQSLWSNGFGAASRAQQKLTEANALVSYYSESHNVKTELINAESSYWRLAIARQLYEIQTETLDRAKKIRDWNAKRVRMTLADKSDLLQAETNFQMRKLDVEVALDEVESASRAFNSARGIDSDEVDESLIDVGPELIKKLRLPQEMKTRDDVYMAQYASEAAEANAKMGYERNLPSFDVFATTAFNGRDADSSEAMRKSFRSTWLTWTAGIRFSAPLRIGAQLDTLDGYRKEQLGKEKVYQRKLFDQKREWEDLRKQFLDLQERFDLARQLEESQKEKLAHEKNRLEKGRTTTYQVLTFEQDFALSRLTRLKYQMDILLTFAKMRLYQ